MFPEYILPLSTKGTYLWGLPEQSSVSSYLAYWGLDNNDTLESHGITSISLFMSVIDNSEGPCTHCRIYLRSPSLLPQLFLPHHSKDCEYRSENVTIRTPRCWPRAIWKFCSFERLYVFSSVHLCHSCKSWTISLISVSSFFFSDCISSSLLSSTRYCYSRLALDTNRRCGIFLEVPVTLRYTSNFCFHFRPES